MKENVQVLMECGRCILVLPITIFPVLVEQVGEQHFFGKRADVGLWLSCM